MKRVIIILFIGVLMSSCGSRRAVSKRPVPETNTEKEITKTKPVENSKEAVEVKPTAKTYANATEAYIDTYKTIAKEEMQKYGVPASITLAQGILESGSGKGRLSVEANNHFGIKCHGWTGEKIFHDDDASQECFRKYEDSKNSFRDHSLFLRDRKRYAKLFKLKQENYKGWARELRAAGYATDRKYPQKLISLIERYNLDEFDKDVLGKTYNPQKDVSAEIIKYTVAKGDTLYSISKKYNITVKELQNINALQSTALNIGQVLQIKRSPKN